MKWTDENIETARAILTEKIRRAHWDEMRLEDIVATVVADMALLSDGIITFEDYYRG